MNIIAICFTIKYTLPTKYSLRVNIVPTSLKTLPNVSSLGSGSLGLWTYLKQFLVCVAEYESVGRTNSTTEKIFKKH